MMRSRTRVVRFVRALLRVCAPGGTPVGSVRPALALVAVVLLVTGAVPGASSLRLSMRGAEAGDYRAKAAFLFNLARFVEWPAHTFAAPAAPLNLCVLGVDPFGSALDDTLKGRLVANRRIVIRRMTELEPGCHVLFISGSEKQRMVLLTEQLRAASVLTVSEEEGFNSLGGMIELFAEGDSVQFNIAPEAVERAGLHASARLVALAANQRRPAGGRR